MARAVAAALLRGCDAGAGVAAGGASEIDDAAGAPPNGCSRAPTPVPPTIVALKIRGEAAAVAVAGAIFARGAAAGALTSNDA
jgi:hypothetical protein